MFTNTLIIGAGGTGGQLIPPLLRLLQYHPAIPGSHAATVADGDSFEEHNAMRQHIGAGQVGLNKANWMQQCCQTQGLELDADTSYIDKPWLKRWLRGKPIPLVVAAVDNDATRKLCLTVLKEHNSDNWLFISPGNADASDPAAALRGNVIWYGAADGRPVGLDPCELYVNISNPQDDAPRHGTCAAAAPSKPQLIAANSLAAALTLTVITNILDGLVSPDNSCVFFDGRNFKITHS